MNQEQQNTQFKINRSNQLKKIYSDDQSTRKRYDQAASYRAGSYKTAVEVRNALETGSQNLSTLIDTSKQLYATNPIYASVIDYLSTLYM